MEIHGELKNTVTEIKNSQDVLSSRIEMRKESLNLRVEQQKLSNLKNKTQN